MLSLPRGWVARLGRWLRENPALSAGRTVLIGRDTRGSGPALATAVAAGLKSEGWDVESHVGVLPTPAVSRRSSSGPCLG